MKKKLPIIIPIACGVLCIALIAVAVVFAWSSPSPADEGTDATSTEPVTEPSAEPVTEPATTGTADRDNIGYDIFK